MSAAKLEFAKEITTSLGVATAFGAAIGGIAYFGYRLHKQKQNSEPTSWGQKYLTDSLMYGSEYASFEAGKAMGKNS